MKYRCCREKWRLTANERNWHGPCKSVGIHRNGPDGGYRKDNIMAHFNIDSFKSYALAAVASLYASVMLFGIASSNSLIA
ncbi:MAG: hypothetical protein CVT78_12820 [Alphaproteobacteria bacterium HGW-Alphaproteobacteria-17]|nr:MAG: hypothetical protein CVT78_12820 [Alphaproteobacteria bacterium HGW-Alphaproteobacteria-17]